MIGKMVFSAGNIEIDGKRLPLPTPRADLVSVLGEPSRRTQMLNTILTWDELGVCAHETRRERVATLAVAFQPEEIAYAPHSGFAGKVTVDDTDLHGASGPDELTAAGFEKHQYFDTSWKRSFGPYLMTVQTAEEGGLVSLELEIESDDGYGTLAAPARVS